MEPKKSLPKVFLFSIVWILLNILLTFFIVKTWLIPIIICIIAQSILIGFYTSPPRYKQIILSIGWILNFIPAFFIASFWVLLTHYDMFLALVIIGLFLGLYQWFLLAVNNRNGALAVIFSTLGMFITSLIIYGELGGYIRETTTYSVLGSIAYGLISGIPFSYLLHSPIKNIVFQKHLLPKYSRNGFSLIISQIDNAVPFYFSFYLSFLFVSISIDYFWEWFEAFLLSFAIPIFFSMFIYIIFASIAFSVYLSLRNERKKPVIYNYISSSPIFFVGSQLLLQFTFLFTFYITQIFVVVTPGYEGFRSIDFYYPIAISLIVSWFAYGWYLVLRDRGKLSI